MSSPFDVQEDRHADGMAQPGHSNAGMIGVMAGFVAVLLLLLAVAFRPFLGESPGVDDGTYAPSDPSDASTNHPPVDLPSNLLELKTRMEEQRPLMERLLAGKQAEETKLGYLRPVADVDLDLETRRAIQQENIWRKEVFTSISEITKRPVEEVAGTYARLAEGK